MRKICHIKMDWDYVYYVYWTGLCILCILLCFLWIFSLTLEFWQISSYAVLVHTATTTDTALCLQLCCHVQQILFSCSCVYYLTLKMSVPLFYNDLWAFGGRECYSNPMYKWALHSLHAYQLHILCTITSCGFLCYQLSTVKKEKERKEGCEN